MSGLDPGTLDTQIRIERPVPDNSLDGAGSGGWAKVADVWAGVQDVLPSRAERLAEGISSSERPARVRMYYRDDVTGDCRFVAGAKVVDEAVDYSGARIMQIVSGPAGIGHREGLEFMVTEFKPAGNPA